jgi:hypothetical protein
MCAHKHWCDRSVSVPRHAACLSPLSPAPAHAHERGKRRGVRQERGSARLPLFPPPGCPPCRALPSTFLVLSPHALLFFSLIQPAMKIMAAIRAPAHNSCAVGGVFPSTTPPTSSCSPADISRHQSPTLRMPTPVRLAVTKSAFRVHAEPFHCVCQAASASPHSTSMHATRHTSTQHTVDHDRFLRPQNAFACSSCHRAFTHHEPSAQALIHRRGYKGKSSCATPRLQCLLSLAASLFVS